MASSNAVLKLHLINRTHARLSRLQSPYAVCSASTVLLGVHEDAGLSFWIAKHEQATDVPCMNCAKRRDRHDWATQTTHQQHVNHYTSVALLFCTQNQPRLGNKHSYDVQIRAVNYFKNNNNYTLPFIVHSLESVRISLFFFCFFYSAV